MRKTTRNTPTVLRIEDKENPNGPYRMEDLRERDPRLHRALDRHNRSNRHPVPCCDELLRRASDNFNCWAHGFVSKRQFREWFTPHALRLLYENGFHAVLFTVPADSVKIHRKQVVFDRRDFAHPTPVSLADCLTLNVPLIKRLVI